MASSSTIARLIGQVKLMGMWILQLYKKVEDADQFKEEVVNNYKAHLAKLALENNDLRRHISRNINKLTQLGAVDARSLLPSLEISGFQMEDAPSA